MSATTTESTRITERARGENRLAWKLVAPAIVVMLAVTAYPMLRALYLSLFQYRLTAPDDREFVGLENYWNVLTDTLWWRDIWNTVFIMVVTVAVKAGDSVKKGQKLFTVEAMKMETTVSSEVEGRIPDVLVKAGSRVEAGDLLLRVE